MQHVVGRGGGAHPGDRGRDPAGAELPDQRARGPRPLLRRQEQPVWTHGVLQVGIVYRGNLLLVFNYQGRSEILDAQSFRFILQIIVLHHLLLV